MEKNLYSMRYINTEDKTFGMNVTQIEKYCSNNFRHAVHYISDITVDGVTTNTDNSLKYYVDKITGAMYDQYLDEVFIRIDIDKKLERVDIVVKYEDEKGEDQRSILYIKKVERS